MEDVKSRVGHVAVICRSVGYVNGNKMNFDVMCSDAGEPQEHSM